MKKKIEKLLTIAIYFFLFSVLFLTYKRYDYAIIESFQKDGGSIIALDPELNFSTLDQSIYNKYTKRVIFYKHKMCL